MLEQGIEVVRAVRDAPSPAPTKNILASILETALNTPPSIRGEEEDCARLREMMEWPAGNNVQQQAVGGCSMIVRGARRARQHLYFLAQNFVGLKSETERRSVVRNRIVLAARFISGAGIEIGGLGRPLPVPLGVKVKYVDRLSRAGLLAHYQDMGGGRIAEPDIVDDAQTLTSIADNSQDFVIANHVIEHLPNPILFFHNAFRVLKPGGVLFFALPEKTRTFDRLRPVTPFEHLVDDFRNGPDRSKEAHFREWVRLAQPHNGDGDVAPCTEEECERQVAKLIAEDYSIHYHVWTTAAMIDMLARLKSEFSLPFESKAMLLSGDEVVFVLEKIRQV